MNNAMRRLMKDLRDIMTDTDGCYAKCFSVHPVKSHELNEDGTTSEVNDMFHWIGKIYGPEDTPYQNGAFKIDIRVSSDYPMKPPQITFRTQIFHPNISTQGVICLNILKHQPSGGGWSPTLSIGHILLSIHSLLSDPNPNDPLNQTAGNLYLSDKDAFDAQARVYTNDYAMK